MAYSSGTSGLGHLGVEAWVCFAKLKYLKSDLNLVHPDYSSSNSVAVGSPCLWLSPTLHQQVQANRVEIPSGLCCGKQRYEFPRSDVLLIDTNGRVGTPASKLIGGGPGDRKPSTLPTVQLLGVAVDHVLVRASMTWHRS